MEENIGRIYVDNNHKDIVYKITDNGCHEVISHCSSGISDYHRIKINGKSIDIHRWLYQRDRY